MPPEGVTHLNCRRDQLRRGLQACRAATLALFDNINQDTFCHQAHPDFSPVGWHLGHIAFTESLWLLEHGAQLPSIFPAHYRRLFAADGLPKAERQRLPDYAEICDYLNQVRAQVLVYLETAPLDSQERLWRFIIQHESQHSETIVIVLELQRQPGRVLWESKLEFQIPHGKPLQSLQNSKRPPTSNSSHSMIYIPAGDFEMGNDSIDALDNERPVFQRFLQAYWMDRYPVTCREYGDFMAAGGYGQRQWWSSAGWTWLQQQRLQQPLYWQDDRAWDDHPVCGVSWYEAEAYARFVGKRLPTEAEWEKAASWDPVLQQRRTYPWGENALAWKPDLAGSTDTDATPPNYCNYGHQVGGTTPVYAYPAGQSAYSCHDLLGNVWEWTASWFEGYVGFESYPYTGYSQVYFDGQHRVLRGGSWVTRPGALRAAFRNWYHPEVRQILAGFRCAKDGAADSRDEPTQVGVPI
ncbi:MAG: ergothioneine biosynthesis protein EgtB [Cyanothece sp. SIO1E1]|nr:ergothioneine biosynthesis protein EgtB [Cyanothece sp. SIO1E1]